MLAFQELGGSPHEKYTLDGFSATRQFVIPWEQRVDFVHAVFGDSTQPLVERRLVYPGRSDVFADTLDFEPLESDMIGVRMLANLKTDLVDYNGSFAKATVRYSTTDGKDRNDLPVGEDGTSLTYRMVIDSEESLLPPGGWVWTDTNVAIPIGTEILKKVPVTEHVLTWGQVINPPWTAINICQGKVNVATFLGCPAGTLLFRGAEANKLYQRGTGIVSAPIPFAWAIKYTFRERSVKMNGQVYGWNHFYREGGGNWVPIQHGSSSLYDSGDFDSLFLAEPPTP